MSLLSDWLELSGARDSVSEKLVSSLAFSLVLLASTSPSRAYATLVHSVFAFAEFVLRNDLPLTAGLILIFPTPAAALAGSSSRLLAFPRIARWITLPRVAGDLTYVLAT